ncbi:MAG: hypothetical protein FJ102_01855 [Deltaproteobacteria bacterium]|nr:hypothetical protein [Deltaproteobacteria bacterium]
MRTLSLLALVGCIPTADNELVSTSDMAPEEAGDAEADADTDSDADGDSDADADDDTAPPETEDDPLLYSPAVTDQYLFVVNPSRDSLTRVTVDSLAVQTVAVGTTPTTVHATADSLAAVVLNEGDDSVSIVNGSTLEVTTMAVRDGLNRLSMSDDEAWAMAWHDPGWPSSGTTDGVISFNEVSLLRVDPPEHVPLVVGYEPKDVRWTPDGARAVVVSDTMLSVVSLDESPQVTLIPIADDDGDAPEAEEVELSLDGEWAFVRQFGVGGLLAVHLDDQAVTTLDPGGVPTDMDIDPSGTALAVLVRATHELLRYDLADPLAAPTVTELGTEADYGSLAFVGTDGLAVLYTNATLTPSLAVWDSASGTVSERTLVKPVSTVGVIDGYGAALVFHTEQDQDGLDRDDPFAGENALTMLDLATGGSTPLLLSRPVVAWGATDEGRYAFAGLEGAAKLEVLDFATHLPEEIELASAPTHVGALPGRNVGYASMEHELGRIGFYDVESGEMDTLTGFELNSEIEH